MTAYVPVLFHAPKNWIRVHFRRAVRRDGRAAVYEHDDGSWAVWFKGESGAPKGLHPETFDTPSAAFQYADAQLEGAP